MDIDFNRLPLTVRQRFVALTHNPRDPRIVWSFSNPSLSPLAWIVGIVALMASLGIAPKMPGYGMPWITAFGGVAFAAWIFGGSLVKKRHPVVPFVPGHWVFASHAVYCWEKYFTVLPFDAQTVFRVVEIKRRKQGEGTKTSYFLQVEAAAGTMRLPTGSQREGEEVRARMYEAFQRYAAAWAQGDHQALSQMDPFYECTMAQTWIDPAAHPGDGPRITPVPAKVQGARVGIAAAIGLAFSLVTIAVVALTRDDDDATASVEAKPDPVAEAKVVAKKVARDAKARKLLETALVAQAKGRDKGFSKVSCTCFEVQFPFKQVAWSGTPPNEWTSINGNEDFSDDAAEAMSPVIGRHLRGWYAARAYSMSGEAVFIEVSRKLRWVGEPIYHTSYGKLRGIAVDFAAKATVPGTDVSLRFTLKTKPPPPEAIADLGRKDTEDAIVAMLEPQHAELGRKLGERLFKD